MDPVTHTQALSQPLGAPPGEATLRWVEQCLGKGAEVRMVRPLPGGTAHANHALLVESRSGSAHRLVLRRWTARDAPGADARTDARTDASAASGTGGTGGPARRTFGDTEFSPEREIAALALLAAAEVATPSLVAADPAGAYCDVPALLISRLPGHPPRPSPDDLPEYLIQLAAALLLVHGVNGAATMPPYVPHNRLDVRVPPEHALRPELWERVFEAASRPAPEAPARFIHRDYHADNTLWTYGKLTGVVDWSDASSGPVAVDVAHMRRCLAVRYGPSVADRFRSTFDMVSGGHAHDPYWDVRSVLDLLPEVTGAPLDAETVPLLEDYLAALLPELHG
ncbi:aminoglycoside phosphotransferase family protein [Actinomadura sp. WMMB 499]|uniref:aminoglycoside phosphotransferase family protein n=1 Tax=Actinomadura sp. WMMB 499 TaxID=1219491 RepID=UPI0012476929|nr:aminoglycoside phosphotransferase family protein [Actinomadura sp. WMMB 499]QFG23961.1 aminoglycoside phosphotransferase family protein [Actinomadura sp. WMMB 499]